MAETLAIIIDAHKAAPYLESCISSILSLDLEGCGLELAVAYSRELDAQEVEPILDGFHDDRIIKAPLPPRPDTLSPSQRYLYSVGYGQVREDADYLCFIPASAYFSGGKALISALSYLRDGDGACIYNNLYYNGLFEKVVEDGHGAQVTSQEFYEKDYRTTHPIATSESLISSLVLRNDKAMLDLFGGLFTYERDTNILEYRRVMLEFRKRVIALNPPIIDNPKDESLIFRISPSNWLLRLMGYHIEAEHKPHGCYKEAEGLLELLDEDEPLAELFTAYNSGILEESQIGLGANMRRGMRGLTPILMSKIAFAI